MTNYVEFILYVKNQELSRDFYKRILFKEPTLDVPGMTEFELSENVLLGLMPEQGIATILKNVPHPELGNGIPRCEIYLLVDDPQIYYDRAVETGATAISEASIRSWGHRVSYVADPDGHIIAFASR